MQAQARHVRLLTRKIIEPLPFIEAELSIKDRNKKICTTIYYGEVDQWNVGGAGGACSVIIVAIIDWLYKNLIIFPSKIGLDKVIICGSLDYNMLLEYGTFKIKFLDGYFVMNALLKRKN